MPEIEYQAYQGPTSDGCLGRVMIVGGAIATLIGGGLLAVFVLIRGWEHLDLFWAIVGLVLLIAGLGVLVKGIGQHVNQTRLEPPRVELGSFTLDLGEALYYRVTFEAKRPVSLNTLAIKVSCEEYARYQAGTNSRTYKQELHVSTQEETSVSQLLPGTPVVVEGVLEIPPGGPPTFQAPNNRFSWRLIATYDIPRWPDLSITVPFEVRPRMAEGVSFPHA